MIQSNTPASSDGPFIGDEWWLSYSKTDCDKGPRRQFELFSKQYGCLGLEPWLDNLDEHQFFQMMLIRAAPKLLTALNWVVTHYPDILDHKRLQQVVDEAQWTYEEWTNNEQDR